MTQVRLGRKEQRRQRNAFAAQRPLQDYASFIKTSGRKTTPFAIIEGVVAGDGELDRLLADMHAQHYFGGIPKADFTKRLFDPALTDLRQLPAGLLDAKEVLPPLELLPKDTKAALRTFLERLMLLNGSAQRKRYPCDEDADKNYYDLLVEGWGLDKDAGRVFNEHVEDLWKVKARDKGLYLALVGGRFAPVLERLREQHRHDGQADDSLRRLLVRQSLIWCAHDVQLVIARLTKLPEFGGLIDSSVCASSPEGVMNDLRRNRGALEETLNLFYCSSDWRERDVPPGLTDIDITKHRNKKIRKPAKQFDKMLKRRELEAFTPEMAADVMRHVAATLRAPIEALTGTADDISSNDPRLQSFSTVWYGLSSALAAAAVTLRRLIQAETQMPAMVDALISGSDTSSMFMIGRALPAYCEKAVPNGSLSRLNDLLALYRVTLLDEQSNLNVTDHPWKVTNAAQRFLKERGQREIEDHEGDARDPRRSFYLLDVLPEQRFCKGFAD